MKSNAQSMATGFAMGALFCLVSMAWVDIWYTQPRPGGWGRAHFCVECERELNQLRESEARRHPVPETGDDDWRCAFCRWWFSGAVNYHWEYRK